MTRWSAVRTVVLLVGVAASGCEPPDETGALASWRGGRITVEALDAGVRAASAPERQAAEASSLTDWVSERVRELAVEEIVSRRAEQSQSVTAADRLRTRFGASREIGRGYMARRCGDVEVPEEQIEAAWRKRHPEPRQEWILLRHIYRRAGADPQERAAARERLEDLDREIEAGASFLELARLHSESETAKEGGLIGRLSRSAPVDETVLEAAWALGDGEVSGVVETGNGMHLLLREASGTTVRPALEEVRQELEQALRLAAFEQCGREVLAGLAEVSPILVDREALLDPTAAGRPSLIVGEESFTAPELEGLSPDGEPLLWLPQPGELLRQFGEAVLLTREALDADPTLAEPFGKLQQAALERLLIDRQWRAERRRSVETRPEGELKAYFEEHRDRFRSELELDLGLLLVDGEGRPGRRAALERARQARARLLSGESFETLAQTLSDHRSADDGGRLGMLPLPRVRTLVGTRATTAALGLELDEVSEPMLFQDGPHPRYALVKLFGRTEPQARSWIDARDDVISTLAAEEVRRLDREVAARLLEEEEFELHTGAIDSYVRELDAR